MTDYTVYRLSRQQFVLALIQAGSLLYLLGIIFFRHPLIALFLALLAFFYPRHRRKELLRRRREELTRQFGQALLMLASSLSAGRSLENAFQASLKDLRYLYPDPNTDIIREFSWIAQKLSNGETIEKIMQQLSHRTQLEDIRQFYEVLSVCKRTGGNLVEVIRQTAYMISEKQEIQQDIAVIVAQKKFEAKILNLAPIVFVAVLNITSPDYMAPLFAGPGRMVMIAALALLSLAYFINRQIMNIKV